MPKRIVILGSTGSIGTAAVRVAAHLAPEIEVVGLAAGGNRVERLAEQAEALDCNNIAVADPARLKELRALAPASCRVQAGPDALRELAATADADMVLCAMPDARALDPVLTAVHHGKDVALATKEVLVMAGELVLSEARRHGVHILPVDSEHSAIFQCLEGRRLEDVRRLILTASGGPFRTTPAEDLERVTPEQALAHPTWRMGVKVTIESAALLNKGLEMIEACRLFDIEPSALDVVVHPQSVVHSMVEMIDGSVLAQLGVPDMAVPIQYALTWPERRSGIVQRLDLVALKQLDFEAPDPDRFPALRLARQALDAGGTMTAVYNAAVEVGVDRFLAGSLPLPGIARLVGAVMAGSVAQSADTVEAVCAADERSRALARELLEKGRIQ